MMRCKERRLSPGWCATLEIKSNMNSERVDSDDRWAYWFNPAVNAICAGLLFLGIKRFECQSKLSAHFRLEALRPSLVGAFISWFYSQIVDKTTSIIRIGCCSPYENRLVPGNENPDVIRLHWRFLLDQSYILGAWIRTTVSPSRYAIVSISSIEASGLARLTAFFISLENSI